MLCPHYITKTIHAYFNSKIAKDALVADGLYRGLVELLYSNKTVYLVGKSGALRRERRSFAKSEAGKFVYIPLGITRRVHKF